ncbi:sigma-70 family RNA polymerase sigma factor [Halobacillus litoralis]|uniref:sigma-70 family RNA polymerase sigma factor n=1 Tax=Halobacillus litoralis TaxID=45668 RepID=UPI00137049EE|nr:sigma-70 family RNA polymerase sigma factor [Halobacillus litoralis]
MFKEYTDKLSKFEKLLFLQFQKDHEKLIKNPLVKKFLEQEEHFNLLIQNLKDPSDENRNMLDSSFREYYTGVKVINYLSKTIHWGAVNFDKKQRREKNRFPLVMDGTVDDDESSLVEGIPSSEPLVDIQVIENVHNSLENKIENERLKIAFSKLTERQKKVLEFVYGNNLTLTKTAHELGITQQGASKIQKKALERLRREMEGAQ